MKSAACGGQSDANGLSLHEHPDFTEDQGHFIPGTPERIDRGERMARRLTPNKPAGKQTARIVRHELNASLRTLSQHDPSLEQLDEFVHDARKRLKKVRSLLRLVREEMGPRAFHRENSSFRKSAQPLRDIRDAHVLIETLDRLTDSSSSALSVRACSDLREFLEARKQRAWTQFWGNGPGCKRVLRKLRKARLRSHAWKLARLGWSDLRQGLKDVYVAGSQAFVIARANQTTEHLHEWRKQVKCFWYQLQVLGPVWRCVRDELGRELDVLAEILGEDHDLAILHQVVQSEVIAGGRDADLDDLTIVIDHRRSELERAAFELGQRVYGYRPRAVIKQIERWWKA